jgi:hypothetical protein
VPADPSGPSAVKGDGAAADTRYEMGLDEQDRS